MREAQGRAYRRFQVSRIKQQRKRYWNGRYEPLAERQLGMVVKTRTFCSSPYCCGNPRSVEGGTIQERRLFQDLLNKE